MPCDSLCHFQAVMFHSVDHPLCKPSHCTHTHACTTFACFQGSHPHFHNELAKEDEACHEAELAALKAEVLESNESQQTYIQVWLRAVYQSVSLIALQKFSLQCSQFCLVIGLNFFHLESVARLVTATHVARHLLHHTSARFDP